MTQAATVCTRHDYRDGDLCSRCDMLKPMPGAKREVDPTAARVLPFHAALSEYWAANNPADPKMPWNRRDTLALLEFLRSRPALTELAFRLQLSIRATQATVAHQDRVYLWLNSLGKSGGAAC